MATLVTVLDDLTEKGIISMEISEPWEDGMLHTLWSLILYALPSCGFLYYQVVAVCCRKRFLSLTRDGDALTWVIELLQCLFSRIPRKDLWPV